MQHREGNVVGGKGQTGEHSGQEGEAESERKAAGGSEKVGLSAEKAGAQSCRYQVRYLAYCFRFGC